MTSITIRRLDGSDAHIDAGVIDRLATALRGKVLTAASPGYDTARSIWNAMIDRRPALIIQCAGAADVKAAVELAREHSLLVAVRGGGHNIAGAAVCDGGLMIDLSPMRGVRVDPRSRTARVEPGCTLGDFDRETQAFGLATPLGINSTTGVAGLTLGGGFGWLTRRYGMTVDNLLSADVVTADGELLTATERRHADLFWALRGGGGNFGVVTSFELRLHPVGPDLFSGLVVYPFAEAASILDRYRRVAAEAPDELSAWVVVRKAPPLPFLPAAVHGTEILAIAMLWAGAPQDGAAAAEPLRQLATPLGEHLGAQPYVAFQSAFDPLLAPGARNYWKSHDFDQLSDGAIATILQYAAELPSPQCEIFVAHLGGAMRRVAPDATAYPHRRSQFVMNVHGRWNDPADDARCIAWTRAFFESAAPHATGGVYVNFLTEDEQDRVRAAYGDNFDRLGDVKATYDPDNLFRVNQNIAPGTARTRRTRRRRGVGSAA